MMSDSESTSTTLPNSNNTTTPELPKPLSNIRTDLIETAVKFLKDPQVQSAPLSKRLAFLEKKGLTAEEIDLALLKVNGGSRSPDNSGVGIINDQYPISTLKIIKILH